MNEADFARSIRRVWVYAQKVSIDELFSDPSSFQPSPEFAKLSIKEDTRYEDLYLLGLKHSQYNILLKDYSYFQFSMRSSANLRFAYYPNPFLGASKQALSELNEQLEYVEEGIIDLDDYLHGISELRYSQHPPPVRYENAPSQYVAFRHPCSHLHFGHHPGNRWAVRRVLTPAAFGLLIMKQFYSVFWYEAGEINVSGSLLSLDQALVENRQDCRILPEDFFSPDEERQFVFN